MTVYKLLFGGVPYIALFFGLHKELRGLHDDFFLPVLVLPTANHPYVSSFAMLLHLTLYYLDLWSWGYFRIGGLFLNRLWLINQRRVVATSQLNWFFYWPGWLLFGRLVLAWLRKIVAAAQLNGAFMKLSNLNQC